MWYGIENDDRCTVISGAKSACVHYVVCTMMVVIMTVIIVIVVIIVMGAPYRIDVVSATGSEGFTVHLHLDLVTAT
jgi:hypothetical protein